MGILDKLQSVISRDDNKELIDAIKSRDWSTKPGDKNASDNESVEKLYQELVDANVIKDYMQDDLRHRIEASDETDFISMLARSAIENNDIETVKKFMTDYKLEIGEHEIEAAEESGDSKMIEFISSNEYQYTESTDEKISNCCGAKFVDETLQGDDGVCAKCGEHAKPVTYDEFNGE